MAVKKGDAPKKAEAPEAPPHPQGGGPGKEHNRPAASFRLGRIRVSVWRNLSAQGVWYSFTLSRTYKDPKSGQYKSASSFGVDDLLAIGEVCRQARWWAEDEHQREYQRQAQAAADQAGGKGDAYEPPADYGPGAEGASTDIPF